MRRSSKTSEGFAPSATSSNVCPKCGQEFRLVWIGYDPPEPYGDVCGCPDPQYDEARAEKSASDAEAMRRAMGPDHTREGMFVYHNCHRCDHGKKPCVQGGAHRCDNPHARND